MTKYTARSYDLCVQGAHDKTFAVSATGAAAAAVTITITHDSATYIYVTAVLITSTNPAAVVNGKATLTGLTTQEGGSGEVDIQVVESAAAGTNIYLQFDNPIPSVDTATNVVLTVPAITSGGAVSATLFGYRRPE